MQWGKALGANMLEICYILQYELTCMSVKYEMLAPLGLLEKLLGKNQLLERADVLTLLCNSEHS